MRVILLEKVNNLGNIGEEVSVRSGYARNFLIPKNKAIFATKDNIASFESRRFLLERDLMNKRFEAESCIAEIKKLGSVTITAKSGVSGKLFGSIGRREIAFALVSQGINISRHNVRLHANIRCLGDYNVIIQIEHDVFTALNVHVVSNN